MSFSAPTPPPFQTVSWKMDGEMEVYDLWVLHYSLKSVRVTVIRLDTWHIFMENKPSFKIVVL